MQNFPHITDQHTVDLELRRRESGGPYLLYTGPDKKVEGRWRALKTLRPALSMALPRARDRFINVALNWMSIWPHPNLVSAEQIIFIENRSYVALDYATQGNLRQCIRQNLQPAQALYYAQMIASGLRALHSPDREIPRKQMPHGNLKPENILVQGNGLVQLSDIGFANILNGGSAFILLESSGGRGDSMAYRAPESWAQGYKPSRVADMYAFGIILCELLTGHHPLTDLNDGERLTRNAWHAAHTRRYQREPRPLAPAVSEIVELLYRRCLSPRHKARPTAHEAVIFLQNEARRHGWPVYAEAEVMARTPENKIWMWVRLANALEQCGFYSEAHTYAENALKVDPRNPQMLSIRASYLARKGQTEEAVRVFEDALAAQPVDARASKLSRTGAWAVTHRQDSGFEKAEQAFLKALSQAPQNAELWRQRAVNELSWAYAVIDTEWQSDMMFHLDQAVRSSQMACLFSPGHTPTAQLLALAQRLRHTLLHDPMSEA
ncbi:MAG TPA: protein kinase [Ktedonobacterales bacterium]|nr:protein kinase [Ktedonobacterales bacterium]